MSIGGDGVLDTDPWVQITLPQGSRLPFIRRRFRIRGRLNIQDYPSIHNVRLITCVLCGGLILDGDANAEHPLPQWLHRYAGDVGEQPAKALTVGGPTAPTWRQLCLDAHINCNSVFATKIENPAQHPLKAIVEGRSVTWVELDRLFDWLDKVKTSTALMGAALDGHRLQLGYHQLSFPNRRVGAFDRAAFFLRVSDFHEPLDLWNCRNVGFLTTPSAIALRVKDLLIIYVSNDYLLSSAFGLGTGEMPHPTPGTFSAGFGSRYSRIPSAKIIAQPMRRQDRLTEIEAPSRALQRNGDGFAWELKETGWDRVRSTGFDDLPRLPHSLAYPLAALEIVEWILLSKEADFSRNPDGGTFFLNSVDRLKQDKLELLDLIAARSHEPLLPENDRSLP